MSGFPRESAFMPTIKCSICGNDIEISRMGDHICSTAPVAESAAPPLPDLLGGAFASLKQTVWGFGSRAAPPTTVDTSAANKAFTKPDQLTPVSSSTGSRTISPKTPTGQLGGGSNGDGYFSPEIAESPSQGGRDGGYGGFGEPQPYEGEPMYGYNSSIKKQAPAAAPSVLQRMNTIAPGPFEISRRAASKNAFAPRNDRTAAAESDYQDMSSNGYGYEQPPAAASYSSSNSGSIAPPRAPRKNGYGGFGPPQRDQDDEFESRPFGSTNRAETFPRPSQSGYDDMPARAPSAPGARPGRSRRPTMETTERPVMTKDRAQRPSFGMRDTSRPPPPRKSLIRPQTAGQDSSNINLADEFGVGNPYHTPSESQSSSNSGYSQLTQPSQPSSASSPARSMGSRRMPSDTSNFDKLMGDLQSSMGSLNPNDASSAPPPLPAAQIPPRSDRRGRPDDLRFDPAIQGGPPPRIRSPLAPPADPVPFASRRDPAVQGGQSRSPPPRTHNRQQSQGRSRGNCKACQLPITGKSIASADGQLTGRYHKACFVCTTCQNPFSSSTFYVLNDKPYDANCYHRLNGSCCSTCDIGIEGQYLEDELSRKHHPDCFRCGDCDKILRDGYFEVNGKSYCERHAWRRVQQPAMPMQPGRNGGLKAPPNGRPFGLPNGNRLGPSGLRPRMEKRMTRMGMM